jgi:REP element-mobilizing transposase RayT
MARQARIKEPFGFYYVHQTGGGEHPLFQADADRERFLEVLRGAQRKFGFRLHAYCVLSPDEYHLVLDMNGSDLSNVMKSVNIGYSMYVRSERPLFKDRYSSKPLSTEEEVHEQIRLIHRPTNTAYNSWCHYDAAVPIPLDWIASPQEPCRECIRTVPEARRHLERIARNGGTETTRLLEDHVFRNQLIRDFRRQSTLSLKEIGQLFGGLTESSVSKILNR